VLNTITGGSWPLRALLHRSHDSSMAVVRSDNNTVMKIAKDGSPAAVQLVNEMDILTVDMASVDSLWFRDYLNRILGMLIIYLFDVSLIIMDYYASRATVHKCIQSRQSAVVPCVRDYGYQNGFLFLVTSPSGTSVNDFLLDYPPRSATRRRFLCKFGAQLFGVLHRLHMHSIVHRDIKPSNLIVTIDGNLGLIDFGIAIHQGLQPTEHWGTPNYASRRSMLEQIPHPHDDFVSACYTLYSLYVGEESYIESPRPSWTSIRHHPLIKHALAKSLLCPAFTFPVNK
jgi:serine/threonine protein kinase